MTETIETAEPVTVAAMPKQAVHKRSLDQVFVTDYQSSAGDYLCAVGAELPLAHARFSDTAAPYHDLVLVAETCRQAGIVVAAEFLGVPAGRQFLLRELVVELDPLEANRKTRETQQMTISADSSSQIKARRGGRLTGGLMRSDCTIAGHRSGMCQVVGAWVLDEMYQSLRGEKAVTGEAPAVDGQPVEPNAGKTNPQNVVVTPVAPTGEPREHAGTMLIDVDDPTFFDHPLDHVPGLLLLEAMKQASIAAACRERGVTHECIVPTSFHVKFSRVAEFVPDVVCRARVLDDFSSVDVECAQNGKRVCGGAVGIAVL